MGQKRGFSKYVTRFEVVRQRFKVMDGQTKTYRLIFPFFVAKFLLLLTQQLILSKLELWGKHNPIASTVFKNSLCGSRFRSYSASGGVHPNQHKNFDST